jgi:oligopeptide transport system substrate-binding protein
MKLSRRAALNYAMAGSCALALAACGKDQPEAKPGRALRIAIGGRPVLDPQQAVRDHDVQLAQALFAGLVGIDASGGLTPGLAQSWNVSGDGLTYTFRMRSARWSDDRPIVANDFVGSFGRAFKAGSGDALATGLMAVEAAVASVQGRKAEVPLRVTALTEDILQIRLSQPLPALLGLLAHPALALVPLHAIRRYGADWNLPDNLVVSGPFKPTPWGPQNRIELVANPAYWAAGKRRLDSIMLLPAIDDDATFAGFRDGVLDIVTGDAFPFKHFSAIRESMGESLRLEPSWSIAGYLINTRRGPLANAAVRRALSMSLDRQLLVETLQLGTGAVPTAALVPPTMPSYGPAAEPDWWTWPPAQRNAESRRLLAEAGFTGDNPLGITVSLTDSEITLRTFEAAAQQWARGPIRAQALVRSSENLQTALASGDFELASHTAPATVDMPEAFLARTLCNARPLNLSGYCNAEADRALAAALAVADVAARSEALKRAELLTVAETPTISLFADVNRSLVRPDVDGWIDNPTGRHPLDALGRKVAGQ